MTWINTSLGSIAPFSYGKSLPQGIRKLGNVPVYGSSGLTGFHDDFLIAEQVCIIGRKGSVGNVYLTEGPSWPIDTTFFTQGSREIDLRYLFYLLQTLPLRESSDSAVPGLNRDYAHSIRIRLPDQLTQMAVADTLGSLDNLVALNKAQAQTLEAIAQTIFKSWFIDFDPVHAKARGDQPEGMDAETAAFFPDSFDESELGLIPKGWNVSSLHEIAEYRNGPALQKYPAVPGADYLPVIKIPQLKANSVDGAGRASNEVPQKFVVDDSDILFSWSGALEMRFWAGGKGALNQHLFKVVPLSLEPWFVYFSTMKHLSWFREVAQSKATTMGHIQRSHLAEAKVAVPNSEILRAAAGVLAPLVNLHIQRLIENRTLISLRDALLPRLISGELEIPTEMLVE
jgi:type I restriction enzyme S subunit